MENYLLLLTLHALIAAMDKPDPEITISTLTEYFKHLSIDDFDADDAPSALNQKEVELPESIKEKIDRLKTLSMSRYFFTISRFGEEELFNLHRPSTALKEAKDLLKNMAITEEHAHKAKPELATVLTSLKFNFITLEELVTKKTKAGPSLLESAEGREPDLAQQWKKMIDGTESRALEKLIDSALPES